MYTHAAAANAGMHIVFTANYQDVGESRNPCASYSPRFLRCKTFAASTSRSSLLGSPSCQGVLAIPGGCDVDFALRLDLLAACVAFAIVGAILLGAF
jgi:hypothetical protein